MWIAKKDVDVGVDADSFQSRISGPWVQVSERRTESGLDLGGEGVADLPGFVAVGQVQQHRVAGGPLDQGAGLRRQLWGSCRMWSLADGRWKTVSNITCEQQA